MSHIWRWINFHLFAHCFSLLQYKRDIGDGIYDNHQNNNSSNQLAYFNNRYERRLSVESARTLSDSSSDAEDKIHHIKETKRRRNKSDKSIEQCEREIARLQSNVDALRRKLEDSEIKQTSDSIDAISHQSDTKIRSIISRWVAGRRANRAWSRRKWKKIFHNFFPHLFSRSPACPCCLLCIVWFIEQSREQ